MGSKKGIAHVLIVLVLGAVIVAVYFLVFKFVLKKNPIPSLTSKKEARVELKTEYKNPFDRKTQYVNPFDQYKSPFINLQ